MKLPLDSRSRKLVPEDAIEFSRFPSHHSQQRTRGGLMRSIRMGLFLIVLVAVVPSATHASSAVFAIPSTSLFANGTVLATAAGVDRLYVGGDFTLLGQPTGSWVGIGADGKPLAGRPPLHGLVTAAVSDGHGGWFLAGSIDVGAVARTAKVVHLRQNGQLDRGWRLTIRGGGVFDLARSRGTLFLAGAFKTVGGKSRNGIAAVSASGHRLLPWRLQGGGAWFVRKKRRTPAAIFTVVLASSGRTLYLGGDFNRIGKLSRAHLAEVSVASGHATVWNPSPNGDVSNIEPAPGRPAVYIAGNFSQIGQKHRNALAAVDARTGKSLPFDAAASSRYEGISDVLATRETVYVGGGFTTLGGKSRHLVAALDPRSGAVTDWEPNVTGDDVNALAMDDSQGTLYIGGDIVDVGGQRRDRLAGIDVRTGAVTGWDPPVLGDVYLLSRAAGGAIFAGGKIVSVGAARRNGLASLTPEGAITDWDPQLVGTVRALALSPDKSRLYVGGAFAPGDAPAQRNLAVVDLSTGSLRAFGGGTSLGVWALAQTADGSKLDIGGAFTSVAGKRRTRLAQLDARTGDLTAWNSGANDLVRSLLLTPDELYVGGDFTSAGGQQRSRIAKLDTDTGAALGWRPEADDKVWALALRDQSLYVGGEFRSIGGRARNALAAVDSESGQASSWDPSADSTVRSLTLSVDQGHLFAAGDFGKIGNALRGYAEFLLPSGALSAWDPPEAFDGYSMAFTSDGSALVIGGNGGVDIFR
jgi:hypothetical protein